MSIRSTFALLLGTASLILPWSAVEAAEQTQGQIIATGSSISASDPETAQIRALLDALRNVATEKPSRFSSHSVIDEQGNLAELMSLQSQLNIHNLEIIKKEQRGNMTRVEVALNLADEQGSCAAPKIRKVLTTDLASDNQGVQNNHLDLNSVLLLAEQQLLQKADRQNITAARINPALNTYQTAMLATDAYHQADFHLTIGASWQSQENQTQMDQLSQTVNSWLGKATSDNKALVLQVSLVNLHADDEPMTNLLQLQLPAPASISSLTDHVPQDIKQQLSSWTADIWPIIAQQVNCSPNYVRLNKLLDQPGWRINKGHKLGLVTEQRVLLIPEKIQFDQRDDTVSLAPQVFNIQHVEPHSAILSHVVGQGKLPDGNYKLVAL